ncbi:MAG: methyltransferase domain-containing protein [Oceanicaulis sp.]|uniref:class I SAM-dependent methyltransferase n=1 Tax=Glycocaulis sp. TaxID=1969725 RepID=UPI0025BB0BD4|nr:class I SAM-dependent methyltransferase [Glycocaulis sp.]MCC5980384.1 methyltransferase domain-containing protein [Oceanicaulis sp.]MCH8520316.1 methyltransferase domain-containing protein [Glycocaulis sp.]
MTSRIFLDVEAAYDRWAASYDALDNPMVYAATAALERRLERFAGKSVAELGCGTGRNLAALSRAGAANLWGCDLSAGMLEKAKCAAPDAILFQHDITQPLPVERGHFDAALVSLAYEHVETLDQPAAELARIVRPGGFALILEIHPVMTLAGKGAHFPDGDSEIHMPSHAHSFSDWLTAFRHAGLTVSDCTEWRGRDFGPDAPVKLRERYADTPFLVEWMVSR